jgi:predicted transcriptional regulator YdeE
LNFKQTVINSFSVIGKEGTTNNGGNFIDGLWLDAKQNFSEIEKLAKTEDGYIVGFWGLMSDFSRQYLPWEENYTKGLYLAGVEVENDKIAPSNWVKWTVPTFEYIYVAIEKDYGETFIKGLEYLKDNGFDLVGAVQEFHCPVENKLYLFYPIKKFNVFRNNRGQ